MAETIVQRGFVRNAISLPDVQPDGTTLEDFENQLKAMGKL